jgi:hypothetical protein
MRRYVIGILKIGKLKGEKVYRFLLSDVRTAKEAAGGVGIRGRSRIDREFGFMNVIRTPWGEAGQGAKG